jgi:triosephosphate isomerase (TIM)
MKRSLICGNWKMNKTVAEAKEFARDLTSAKLPNADDLVIIAPFTQLSSLAEELKDTAIKLGAQDVFYEESGAYTGEISAPMLKELGVEYCLVGHSERREYFGETDKTCNLKIKALIKEGIIPILCVGEPLAVREGTNEFSYVGTQIYSAFDGIGTEDSQRIVIAYEPIWAIGTGKVATTDQAEYMCGFIRGLIAGLYDNAVAENMPILYGGSMKPDNAKELLESMQIDGGLIGGASLKVDSFAEIAKIAGLCKKEADASK